MSSMPAVPAQHVHPEVRLSLIDRLARAGLVASLKCIGSDRLTLRDGNEAIGFGESSEEASHAGLSAEVTVEDPQFFRHVAFGGSLAAAESFLDGHWSCDDLTALFRIVIRNPAAFSGMDRGIVARLLSVVAGMEHRLRRNSRRGSRKNIEAHYDLGNDFFRLFLDETMMYSSGIFPTADSTLHDASLEKLDRICRRLALGPGDHVLEIGTGWGGFALHAARNFGCRITTTTISRAQFEFARERVRNAGLEDRVTVLCEDYRDLSGRYDKLVSIEMIEAVGHQFFDQFFHRCGELLEPSGLMLLQGIVMNEQAYPRYVKSVDFIQKYVFPGGCLPSVLALGASAARSSALRLLHVEDFAWHYAQTLRCWRDRLHAALDQVRALGYSERFIRLWNYYFSYCEAAFEERATGVVQMLWAGPQSRLDLILTASVVTDRTLNTPASPGTGSIHQPPCLSVRGGP